ncbi:MAG: cell wall degradation protein, partial [Moraxellaceae bacterium]
MLFCLNACTAPRYLSIVLYGLLLTLSANILAQPSSNTSSAYVESYDASIHPVSSLIASRITPIQTNSGAPLSVADIPLTKAVTEFYTRRQSRTVWNNPELFTALLAALESTEFDGLHPDDYHLSTLRKQQLLLAERSPNTIKIQTDMELLATDAYFRALFHLYYGKVNSAGLEAQWNFELSQLPENIVSVLMTESLTPIQLDNIFVETRPQHLMYKSMRAGLIHYRTLADLGGWPTLSTKDSLKPGAISPHVAVLRKRLEITGEYRKPAIYPPLSPVRDTVSISNSEEWTRELIAQGLAELYIPEVKSRAATDNLIKRPVAPVNPDEIFDDRLVAAVKLFQREQYLEADGAIGPATRAALNIPVEARVAQVRINLDRSRWLLHNLPEHIVLVDIAGFKITYFKSNEPVWKSLVQVG